MSIVVAVRKLGKTVIAADTQESFGDRKILPGSGDSTKVTRIGSAYLAQTGWGVYFNVLADYLQRRRVSLRNEREIFSFFQRFWRDLHQRYSFVDDQSDANNKTPFADLDSAFLVVNRGGLFFVSAAMSVTRFESYYAIGSGSAYALGALRSLYDRDLDAEEIARAGCEAAMAFDVYCGGELDVIRI